MTPYRYGFQGQEKDDEISGDEGNGNFINYKYRMHDARLGRFLSIDPLSRTYPHNSPYAFSENRVIDGVELEGLEFSRNPLIASQAINRGLMEILGNTASYQRDNPNATFLEAHIVGTSQAEPAYIPILIGLDCYLNGGRFTSRLAINGGFQYGSQIAFGQGDALDNIDRADLLAAMFLTDYRLLALSSSIWDQTNSGGFQTAFGDKRTSSTIVDLAVNLGIGYVTNGISARYRSGLALRESNLSQAYSNKVFGSGYPEIYGVGGSKLNKNIGVAQQSLTDYSIYSIFDQSFNFTVGGLGIYANTYFNSTSSDVSLENEEDLEINYGEYSLDALYVVPSNDIIIPLE